MTIMGIFMTYATVTFINVYKIQLRVGDNIQAGSDIREFTNNFSEAANSSARFLLFTSFTDRTRAYSNATGDFVVFVRRSRRIPTNGNVTATNFDDPTLADDVVFDLLGYYRTNVGSTNRGPVRSFTIPITVAQLNTGEQGYLAALNAVRPTTYNQALDPVVVELAEGMSTMTTNTTPRLFLNFNENSLVIRGEIRQPARLGNQVSNTYNFTVAPRG